MVSRYQSCMSDGDEVMSGWPVMGRTSDDGPGRDIAALALPFVPLDRALDRPVDLAEAGRVAGAEQE